MEIAQPSIAGRPPTSAFRDGLLKAMPRLRTFAMALCHGSERGEDLVQHTLLKALDNAHRFEPGSNLIGWLYAILRNEYYSEYRRHRREVEDPNGDAAEMVQVPASQDGHIRFLEVHDAFARLTAEHQKALTLIVSGLSYDDAALICACAPGTVKSRVNRARVRLNGFLIEGRFGQMREPERRPDIQVFEAVHAQV